MFPLPIWRCASAPTCGIEVLLIPYCPGLFSSPQSIAPCRAGIPRRYGVRTLQTAGKCVHSHHSIEYKPWQGEGVKG